jgi:PAS domain S-box-containing protein
VPPDIFETIVESVSDAVAVTDGRRVLVYVNQAFARLTGCDQAACQGRPITFLSDALAQPSAHFETTLAPPHRPPVRVEVEISVLGAGSRDGPHHLYLLRDLSERTRIAAALRTSEERFRDFAEISSDWLWELGPDLRFSFVSNSSGGDPRRVLGTRPGELNSDPDEVARWRAHRAVLAAHQPFRDFTHRRRLADGSYQHVSARGKPIYEPSGVFVGYRGTATDVTAQVEAEARIRAGDRRLQECIESLAEGFALFDADDRLVLFNERFRELNPPVRHVIEPGVRFLDIAKAALRLRAIPEAIGQERRWLRGWVELLREPRSRLHRKLNHGWFQINLQRLSDGSLVMIAVDITEVVQREETLREARDAAERANRMKSEFLATMSHELRTPLNAILGFSEIMRDGLFGTLGVARYHDYVADIHQSAQHLLDIIGDVLDMSKLEAGQMTLQPERLEIGDVLGHCVRLMRERAASRELRIDVAPVRDLPALLADQRMLKQIVLNLLSNAVKFTEPGGAIRVEGTVDDRGLWISVLDTGIGIAPSDIPRALTPFQQIEDPMTRRFDGTGLGLPIVKAIMELHGGTVALSSTPGVGTRVSVVFPPERLIPAIADDAAAVTPPATTTPPHAPRSNRRGARATSAS